LSTGWGQWVVFLGKTGTSELNAGGNPSMDYYLIQGELKFS